MFNEDERFLQQHEWPVSKQRCFHQECVAAPVYERWCVPCRRSPRPAVPAQRPPAVGIPQVQSSAKTGRTEEDPYCHRELSAAHRPGLTHSPRQWRLQ